MGKNHLSAAEKLNNIQVDHSLSAAASMADAVRSSRNLADAIVPSGLRTMLDMQRGIRALVDPFQKLGLNIQPDAFASLVGAKRFGLGRFAHEDLVRATKLHDQLGAATCLVEMSNFAAADKSLAALVDSGATTWRDVTRLADSFGVAAAAVHQVDRLAAFDRSLGRVLPQAAWDRLSNHLKATALGRLGFLGHDWDAPVALLTQVGRSLGGAVSWLSQYREEPVMTTAALASDANESNSVEVIIEDVLVCAICDGPMQTFGGDLRWVGPRRGIRRRRIFPVCSTCWEKQKDDDEFLYNALCELTRPSIQVIRAVLPGGHQGDGQAKGVLRLVPIEPAEDE